MLYVSNTHLEFVEVTDSDTGKSEWMSAFECFNRYCEFDTFAVRGIHFPGRTSEHFIINVLSDEDLKACEEFEEYYSNYLADNGLTVDDIDCKFISKEIKLLTMYRPNKNGKLILPDYVTSLDALFMNEDSIPDKEQGYDLVIPSSVNAAAYGWSHGLENARSVTFKGDLLYVHIGISHNYTEWFKNLKELRFEGDITCLEILGNLNPRPDLVIYLRKDVYEKHKSAVVNLEKMARVGVF